MKQSSPFTPITARRFALQVVGLLSALIVMVAGINGCKSDSADINQSVVGSQIQINSTIYGRILDENNIPLSGVQVSVGTASATTDQRGLYILRNVTVPKDRAVIIARKTGYFDAAKAATPVANGATKIEASMMSNATTAIVASASGGTVTATGGAKVTFQPGSFVDASGTAYTGAVSVSLRYLDTKNVNYFDFFSGDNDAQTASGKDVGLITNGVIRVDLRGAAGQKLNLVSTKPASLTFPKSLDPKAPTTMPLWYFDETLGKWKEDGSATLQGNNYVGTVTHFTDWNLDYFDSTGTFGASGDVTLRVVCSGIPIEGVVITIVGDDAPGKYFVHPGGKTGPDGVIHFRRFPANRPTQVDIRADRNNGLYFISTPVTVNITPGQTLDLGDISLNSPCPAAIKGTLTNCGDSSTEGLVITTFNTITDYIYTKHGDFAKQVPSATPISVDALDVNGNQATTVSVPALTSGEIRDIGALKICGTGTISFVDLSIPANSYTSAVKLSPDGSRIAVALYQPSSLVVYDTKTGSVVSTVPVSSNWWTHSMGFSMDNSKLLISNGDGGTTQIYDLSSATATLMTTVNKLSSSQIYDDGTKFIAAFVPGAPTPAVVNVYSTTDGSILATLHPQFSNSSDTAGTFGLIRDENSIVYPDPMGAASDQVWSVGSDAQARTLTVTASSYSFVASEDGLTVAHTPDYMNVNCFDTKTGTKIGTVSLDAKNRESSFALTHNFLCLADHVGSANVIRVVKIADGTSTLRLLSDSLYVRSIDASRDESTVAAAATKTIRIWKMK